MLKEELFVAITAKTIEEADKNLSNEELATLILQNLKRVDLDVKEV